MGMERSVSTEDESPPFISLNHRRSLPISDRSVYPPTQCQSLHNMAILDQPANPLTVWQSNVNPRTRRQFKSVNTSPIQYQSVDQIPICQVNPMSICQFNDSTPIQHKFSTKPTAIHFKTDAHTPINCQSWSTHPTSLGEGQLSNPLTHPRSNANP